MPKLLGEFLADERGATAIEYTIIAAMMAIAVVAGIAAISPKLVSIFTTLGDDFVVS